MDQRTVRITTNIEIPPWEREIRMGDSFSVEVVDHNAMRLVEMVVRMPGSDVTNKFDAAGARWLARQLLSAADEIDPPREES